jgi:hypothetical protein
MTMYALLFLLYSLTFAMHDEGPGLCSVGHVTVHADASGDKGLGVDPNG